MASKNRVGSVRATGSNALHVLLLRKEWGFRGAVISDYYVGHDTNDADEGIRSGVDLMLNGVESGGADVQLDDTSSATAMIALQGAAKNALYCYADTMYTHDMEKGYDLSHMTGAKNDVYPHWKWQFAVGDALLAAGLGIYGFWIYKKFYKKKLNHRSNEVQNDPFR